MFEELTEKFERLFKNLRGQGKLTVKNIEEALREVRRVLLEADVNYKVVKEFIEHVRVQAVGQEVLRSITPAQKVIRVVHNELVELLGGSASELKIRGNPMIVMLCGLQGSGKTTTAAKLAVHFRGKGRRPMLVSVDVHRPAAVDQLRILSRSLNVAFCETDLSLNAPEIAVRGVDACRNSGSDMLIMDTAGRLHVDEEMMEELRMIRDAVNPHEVLFVADGLTGQDAVRAVEGFGRYLTFDGVILTKLDGDARGGAALSITAVTGKPIRYAGVGEKPDNLEIFHPDRMASRILGMGDVLTLVERAEAVADKKEAERLEKLWGNQFTLEDFSAQLQQLKKMGPLGDLVGMIPGAGKVLKNVSLDERDMSKVEAIISSMTVKERRMPHIIDGSRRRRIAHGSGTSVQDVNRLLKQFHFIEKMASNFSKVGKSGRGFRVPFG